MNPKDVRIRIIIAELVAVLDRNLRLPRDILAICCSLLEQIVKVTDPIPPMPDSARRRCCFECFLISSKISTRLMNEVSLSKGTRKRGFRAFDGAERLKSALFTNIYKL